MNFLINASLEKNSCEPKFMWIILQIEAHYTMKKRHTVLVTNDDGIDSFFLHTLVHALKHEFEVFVAAPLAEQSWIGRAISRDKTVHMANYEKLGCRAWALDGTPSDCVNIALSHLMKDKPDFVVSGINITHNTGVPLILSSGTVGGAIEGIHWDIPSIATSFYIDKENRPKIKEHHGYVEGKTKESLENAAKHTVKFVHYYLQHPPKSLVVYNINYPKHTAMDTSIHKAAPARFCMGSLFEKETDASFKFSGAPMKEIKIDEGSDLDLVLKGFITVTEYDLSEYGALKSTFQCPTKWH